MAISTICWRATVSVPTMVVGAMSMERLDKSSAAIWFCLRLSSSMPFIGSRPMKMFSATVRSFIRFSSWWMMEMPNACASRVLWICTGLPSRRISPASIW